MPMKYPPIDYHTYLELNKILGAQELRSRKFEKPAHDEMLFIVIHQTYELWFKQILHEVESVLKVFSQEQVDEKDMGLVNSRLTRVVEIQKILIDQIRVLETMTPLDFLDFRDMLIPASGFQSFQFRLLENKLGLQPSKRLAYNQNKYSEHLPEDQRRQIDASETSITLFSCVERWLERTPFLDLKGFNFWQTYREAVTRMFEEDRSTINANPLLTDEDRDRNLKILTDSENTFSHLFDPKKYEELRREGHWRMSFQALRAALLIQLYRDQPVLHLPFRLITTLVDIDELFTTWRYRHALMVKRLLGSKIGTGGSSGYDYLKATAEKHKVFTDFFQLTTFFVPRSVLPELPQEVEKQLGFYYSSNVSS